MPHQTPSKVRYDRRSRMVVVEFGNGSMFMVPARSLQGLAGASESEIAGVELTDEGALLWRPLGVCHHFDLSMEGVFGTPVATPGLARNREVPRGMEEPPSSDWVGPVIEFLSNNLPGSREAG
ncbi:DUF2442 domain-containing protein [Rhizobium hidalgonense]|uniref:DUF2442 domain-containing protein n=1 Tax=Rhizobium hidalgonense TaxID=1538159 RepID=UPI0035C7542A